MQEKTNRVIGRVLVGSLIGDLVVLPVTVVAPSQSGIDAAYGNAGDIIIEFEPPSDEAIERVFRADFFLIEPGHFGAFEARALFVDDSSYIGAQWPFEIASIRVCIDDERWTLPYCSTFQLNNLLRKSGLKTATKIGTSRALVWNKPSSREIESQWKLTTDSEYFEIIFFANLGVL